MYLFFSIFLVFAFWIFYNLRRNGILNETKYLQQCPYCTHIFFDYTSDAVASETKETLVCPRCQSYIKLENKPSERED